MSERYMCLLKPDFDCTKRCSMYDLSENIVKSNAADAGMSVNRFIMSRRYVFGLKKEKDQAEEVMRNIQGFEKGDTSPSECILFKERMS